MARGKWINKKTAQHFTLVHRPQNDPLIHDESAPSMVLNPTEAPNASKPANSKALADLASELGAEAQGMRANEGEAASYGVYFDDTEYDYMQHLRDLGTGSGGGDVVFVEADSKNKDKGKGKQKATLEDALRQLDVDGPGGAKKDLFDEDLLPSKNLTRLTYQSMQEVPDVIAGLQPDMDPRLREVLEALEDEEYVDNGEDDDLFVSLTKDGKELDDFAFEAEEGFDEDEGGWETDDTAKPTREYKAPKDGDEAPALVPTLDPEEAAEAADQVGDWMADFTKFKKDQKAGRRLGGPPSAADLQSSILSTTTNGGRKKKRKGALTNPSAYSMTSSSMVRTEQLGILDARFDKLEQEVYNGDADYEDTNSMVSGMTGATGMSTMSTVTGPMRGDFDSVLDDFLGGHSVMGKRQVRKGNYKSGTDQLDEIRRALGPARIRGKTAPARK